MQSAWHDQARYIVSLDLMALGSKTNGPTSPSTLLRVCPLLQVTLHLTNLVCLRAISLAACLDKVRAQHWPYTKYDLPESVELRVVVKLRIHLRDIAAGEFRPLRPSCPGLDPSVCFMDVPDFAS